MRISADEQTAFQRTMNKGSHQTAKTKEALVWTSRIVSGNPPRGAWIAHSFGVGGSNIPEPAHRCNSLSNPQTFPFTASAPTALLKEKSACSHPDGKNLPAELVKLHSRVKQEGMITFRAIDLPDVTSIYEVLYISSLTTMCSSHRPCNPIRLTSGRKYEKYSPRETTYSHETESSPIYRRTAIPSLREQNEHNAHKEQYSFYYR
jgi:hypothetical protein